LQDDEAAAMFGGEVEMTTWTLHAAYDPDERVWYTVDCDVPGLVTEGDTLERLRDRAVAVMPELLADNMDLIEEERRKGPHCLRLVAFHESTIPVAA
jgi:predicted RNase H-like HicB family nuclease